MNDGADALDRITKRLSDLERRVDALEHPLAARWPHPAPVADAEGLPGAVATTNLAQAGSVFAMLGRAMLGIAGAYLLRALAETGSLPRLAIAWAGIAYAFLWLAWAARSRSASQLAGTIYACTSALILAPMLWELTMSFRLLPAPMTAGVLCAFSFVAFALASKRNREPVVRVGLIACVALSLALAIVSHHPLPFIVALLLLSAFVEFVPSRDRLPEMRSLAALAADAAVWTLIFIYFSPQSAHADYPQLTKTALLAPGFALLLISVASVTLQTIVRRRQITVFATIQATIAFLLAAVSLADFGPLSKLMILGMICLTLSAASYLGVFTVLSEPRNAAVFAAWGAALLMSGCMLCFSPSLTAACLGVAAVAAIWISRLRRWPSFEFYGLVFLLVAAGESGLLNFMVSALITKPADAPAVIAGLITIFAIVCCAASKIAPGETWKRQVLHLAFAALALGAVAAMVVQSLVSLASLKVIPGAHHLAFIRTLTLCAAALALVFSGTRWRRLELTRLGYASLALVAVKLVAEDLRHGHFAYIAGSIFLFAVTLIAAPRVARGRQKA